MQNTKCLFLFIVLFFANLFWSYVPTDVQANGDDNTSTFELSLKPKNPTKWAEWRPEYQKNVSFVATLKGTTLSNKDVAFGSVTFTFTLSSVSEWEGVCMNYDGETDTANSKDLYFRKIDNPNGTVKNTITVPGEVDESNNPLTSRT